MPIRYAPWLVRNARYSTKCVTTMIARYFQDFTTTRKERYKAKLELVGLTVKDDPYMPCNAARFRPEFVSVAED